jgi:predicted transcriptional regulator of viral defense system
MSVYERIIELVRDKGIVRPLDIEKMGIPREYLIRLIRQGKLERIGRGLYIIPGSLSNENASLAQVCKRVPHAVICLLSALTYHELTTQLPSRIWIALESKKWKPRIEYPSIELIRMSGKAFRFGIETHEIEGVHVKVYSPSKTVADCFKFRNKIGLDVALEALRDTWRQQRVSMDELWTAAKVCRVANVMRPYLESLT